jgi:hypothetical protein
VAAEVDGIGEARSGDARENGNATGDASAGDLDHLFLEAETEGRTFAARAEDKNSMDAPRDDVVQEAAESLDVERIGRGERGEKRGDNSPQWFR